MKNLVAVAAMVALGWGCGDECDPAAQARTLAGPDALDCGDVPYPDDRSGTIACLDAAMTDGTPAHGSWWGEGIDSEVRYSLAVAGPDELYSVTYSGGYEGGDPYLRVDLCLAPMAFSADSGQYECPGPHGPSEVICDH